LLGKQKMKIDVPLKPPEFKRDEVGKFDRPGKTMSKTAKKNKKTENNLPGPGPGRPKGSQNKVTVALKEAILAAGEAAGGDEGMTGYLKRLAIENSSAFASLLAKVLPSTLQASETDGGPNLELRFVRHIVFPDGHIEGPGIPKQLPAPNDYPLTNVTEPITLDSNINKLDE
jgi:hypothetical protein